MTDLVAVGETMALLSSPRVGRLRDMRSLCLSAAGAESNVAIGIVRLGYRASWIGRVGDDEFGELILAALRAEGVDASRAVTDPTAQTALMVKERRAPNVVRVSYYRRDQAGSRLRPEDLDEDLIAGARLLHLSGITLALSASARAATRRAAQLARAAGVPVSFDFNYRSALWGRAEAAEELAAMAHLADIVFAGEEELAILAADGPLAGAQRLSGGGERTVVVKRGGKGALSVGEDGVHEAPAPSVPVVDPVGAGDAFVAGYLAALLDGLDAAGRLAFGCSTGAYAVTMLGDWEGLPTRDDLELMQQPEGTTLR